MYIAEKLRKQNVTAYLAYMYQVEDVIRACGLDIDVLRERYLSRFGYTPEQMEKAVEWYAALAGMMRDEGCVSQGHVQVVRATLTLLQDCHRELLADHKHPDYEAAYARALPVLVELRAKGARDKTEVENCMDAIYGLSVLDMQHRPVTEGTREGLKPVARLMEMLGTLYRESQQ